MPTIEQPPLAVKEIENCWITMADGTRLAARIWMPADSDQLPVPAILEYLPYRKRDGTAERDALTNPYVAGHGYACVRVDMRGNGESEGLMHDEYLKQEQDDALEVIQWLVNQPWCTGKVGMMGISWGGFNSLQVAARRPPALKAIITICSTVDRYADDIHYMGGCLLNNNLSWSSTMIAYSSRPPDPLLVGESWRDMWLHRLENMPVLAENWLRHQRRDDYWKHGSVCEDFSAIQAAVYAVGGWADGYSNAIADLLNGLQCPVKGLIGPWGHRYPHFAFPGPAIGFLQEAVRWWDYWLKGRDNGIMAEPKLRVYLQDTVPPRSYYDHRPGHWISDKDWPPIDGEDRIFYLNDQTLGLEAHQETALSICSPQNTGAACGRFFPMGTGAELPLDQNMDDAGSLVFETAPLDKPLILFGTPALNLTFSVDRPHALISVRISDVRPDGPATLVTHGILNLTHCKSHEQPEYLQPGRRYQAKIRINDCANLFPAGHRLRLSISTAYWPWVWPSPEETTLTVFTGQSFLKLPVRQDIVHDHSPFQPPVSAPPLMAEWPRPSGVHWSMESKFTKEEPAGGEVIIRYVDDYGERVILTHGLMTSLIGQETFRILPHDPLSARMSTHWSMAMGRGQWQVRSESRAQMWADQTNFFIEVELDAYEGEQNVFHKTWTTSIPRDFI
ncbi:MAG: CocE/NonD family hydrolase [Deltaproteobacteria bacterium]|nr:CocE/NonD family hydrolase [Deltaproteobacteria bacterium]